jgi:hypothetical protein
MSVERGSAVRTDDPEVLETVVVRNAVDVVENQRHSPTAPRLVLTAKLADRPFNAGLVEAKLERVALIRRARNEDRCEGLHLACRTT